MFSSISKERKYFIGVIAGDKRSAAGDDLVNVLLSFYSRGCPRLDAESRHTVEFLLGCHIDRAIQRTEHATAVCGGSVGVVLDLAHMGEGVVDVTAVLCAVFFFHILVQGAVEGVDDNAIGEAVIVNDLKNSVADLKGVFVFGGVLLKLDVKGELGILLEKIHCLDKSGDLHALELFAHMYAGIECLKLGKILFANS